MCGSLILDLVSREEILNSILMYIVACLLKARIVKPAETTVAWEWLCKRSLLGSGATNVSP
jgi:hypothetical protein